MTHSFGNLTTKAEIKELTAAITGMNCRKLIKKTMIIITIIVSTIIIIIIILWFYLIVSKLSKIY